MFMVKVIKTTFPGVVILPARNRSHRLQGESPHLQNGGVVSHLDGELQKLDMVLQALLEGGLPPREEGGARL